MYSYSSVVRIMLLGAAAAVVVGCASGPAEIEAPTAEFVDRADDHDVAYQFEMTERDDRTALEVTMHLQTGPDGYTELNVPRDWSNVRDYQGIVDLQVLDAEARVVETSDDSTIGIEHPPEASVTLGYRVVPTYSELTTDEQWKPTVEDYGITGRGNGLFAIPVDDEPYVRQILLDWSDLPDDWAIGNTFGVEDRRQSVNRSYEWLHTAQYVAGDFEVVERSDGDVPLYVAVHDSWEDSVDSIVGDIEQITGALNEWFGPHDNDFVFLALEPLDEEAPAHHGTASTNSILAAMAPEVDAGEPTALRLLAHELVHLWNGATLSPTSEGHSSYAWFREGFTDFYAGRLLIREGLIELEDYLEIRNQELFQYEVSPYYDATNETIAELFWSDSDARRLPYLRGSVIAASWDTSIRQQTDFEKSLDDVMAGLFERARQDEELRFSTELLTDELEPIWAEGLEDLETVVESGDELIPHHEALGPCVEPAVDRAGPYEPGFDLEATLDANEMRGVVPGGAAHDVGLRNGQRLLELDAYTPGGREIASTNFEITVQTGDNTKRSVEFLPSDEPERVRQFGLDEERYEDNPDECLEWFGKY